MSPNEYKELKEKINAKLASERSFNEAYDIFNLLLDRQKYLIKNYLKSKTNIFTRKSD